MPVRTVSSDRSPRKPAIRCILKKKLKDSSARETAASMRKSPRHKLRTTPRSCRAPGVFRVEFDSGSGAPFPLSGGGSALVKGGVAAFRIGGSLPDSGFFSDGEGFGSSGIAGDIRSITETKEKAPKS